VPTGPYDSPHQKQSWSATVSRYAEVPGAPMTLRTCSTAGVNVLYCWSYTIHVLYCWSYTVHVLYGQSVILYITAVYELGVMSLSNCSA